MTEKKTNLFDDAAEMIEIFRALPKNEKAVAIAYIMGRSAQPLDAVFRLPKKEEKGPAA